MKRLPAWVKDPVIFAAASLCAMGFCGVITNIAEIVLAAHPSDEFLESQHTMIVRSIIVMIPFCLYHLGFCGSWKNIFRKPSSL
ncbi:MAG TPA: hypothetical protein VHE10_03415 [Candidatus Paceibacterota bacterium]|nr:hypothetical protein [Candidatus Paceibacterota bacterium]